MSPELWDTPDENITTPVHDATEGYSKNRAGTSDVVFFADALGSGREGKQFYGVIDKVDGNPAYSQALRQVVEDGLMNDMRILHYRVMEMLSKYLWLIHGPFIDGNAANGGAELINGTNQCDTYTFDASGNGTSIIISSSITNPASMGRAGGNPTSLQPGLEVECGGLRAMIVTGNFGGGNSATLTVHRALNPNLHGNSVRITRENKLPPFPVFHLERPVAETTSPGRCRFDIKVEHDLFSGAEEIFSTGWTDDNHNYCVQQQSDFYLGAGCNNTLCPFYIEFNHNKHSLPTASALSDFYIGLGGYLRQLVAGDPDMVSGRDRYTGVLRAMGLRVGCFSESLGLFLAWKTHEGFGIVMDRTGEVDAFNHEIFRNHETWNTYRAGEGLDETDNVGLLAKILADQAAKKDYAATGNFNSSNPASTYERAIGIRRCQSIGFSLNVRNGSGDGDGAAQWVRPVKYTSGTFTTGVPGTYYDANNKETKVVVLATPLTESRVGLADLTYNVLWYLPQFGDVLNPARPPSYSTKLGATIPCGDVETATDVFSYSGATLTMDFALEQQEFFTPGIGEAGTVQFDLAGNVVAGEMAWVPNNPGTTRTIGDGQFGLCPGDRIEFLSPASLAGLSVICVAAAPYSGSTDDDADMWTEGAVGLVEYVRDNWNKRDRATATLEGTIGQTIIDAIDAGITENISVSIFRGAGSPLSTSPTLTLTDGTTPTILNSLTYSFDHAMNFYKIDGRSWDTETPFRLHSAMSVYDARRTHYAEDVVAMYTFLNSLVTHGWREYTVNQSLQMWDYVVTTNLGEEVGEIEFTQFGSEDTPPLSWSAPDLRHSPLTIPPTVLWEGLRFKSTTPGIGTYGVFPYGFGENHNWGFQFSVPVIKLTVGTVGRLQSSDVAEAVINFSIGEANVLKSTRSFPPFVAEVEDGLNVDLSVILFTAPTGATEIEIADTGITIPTPAVGFYDAETDSYTYRATVDFTEVLKAILDGTYNGLDLYMTTVIASVETGTGLAKAMADACIETYIVDDADYEVVWRQMTYRTASINRLMVNLSSSALVAGGQFHHDHEGHSEISALV